MPSPNSPAITHQHLCIAAAQCFCAGGLYGWSALVPLIENTFAGSTAEAGRVFSIAIVSFTTAVLLLPRLPEGVRSLAANGLLGIAGVVSLLLATAAAAYWQFLIFFSVGFGFVSGALYINVLTMAANTTRARWFTPLMVAMFGFGGVVFGPLWRQLLAHGWEAKSLLPLAFLLFFSSVMAMYADKRTLAARLNSRLHWRPFWRPFWRNRVPVTTSVMQTRYDGRFVLIWAIFATGSSAGLMVLGLASKIIEHAGGSVNVASAGIAGIALGNTLGRLSVSAQLCVMSSTQVALLATMTIGAGLMLVSVSALGVSTAIGLSLVALGYGIMASAIPVMVQQQFGAANFSRFFSIAFTAWGLAGLTAPWLAGVLFDASGSFSSSIQLALAATALCGLLLVCFAVTDRRIDAP